MSASALATLLILVGAAGIGCLVLASRNPRWRPTATVAAIISLLAVLEICAILLDVNDVLEP